MRKKSYGLFLMLLLLVFIPIKAQAETSYGSDDWSVVFTADSKMDCNFSTSDMDDVIYGMQPGDNAILTIHLKNENKKATDWYMLNKVLYSLEDRSPNKGTRGGAYTYILTYTNASGVPKTLFDSETVGGDDVRRDRAFMRPRTPWRNSFSWIPWREGRRVRLPWRLPWTARQTETTTRTPWRICKCGLPRSLVHGRPR